ncbi:MAG: peptidase dimerization domain-containing protein [Candidatus Eisenbacteria bacterium]|nr:peptidase dimerization domain-containing protein [Candidatus Eisenbacteria bacterium]
MPTPDLKQLDARIAELAAKYRPLAVEILKEAIRIPADHVDRAPDQGGDPRCGLSNHEGPRLEYLRRRIVEIGAVRRPDDAFFDEFGNLCWTAGDPGDPIPASEKAVIYLDGHTDTVKPLREQWHAKTGGLDPYLGLVDPKRIDRAFLRRELGYLPPDGEWEHLVFGRGSADQLGGVVSQIVSTKVAIELTELGALRGCIVRGYGTVAEEDNDGGGPLYIMRRFLPGKPAELVPDVVILTDSTGDSARGALGIYRGQRGRMQIEVRVTGRSCHGSMPWEGLNPLEHGGHILAEAAEKYEQREGFLDHPFLGHGTRTASWAVLESPSDCAVPDRFTFRFDRRLTVGETPEQAVADVAGLETVRLARAAGLKVEVGVPTYDQPTWKNYVPGNPQIYMSWMTPEEHPAIRAAVDAYSGALSPHIPAGGTLGALRREPRVDRWVFSTDGVGFPVPAADRSIAVPEGKRWVSSGGFRHPAMLGFGVGIEQNTHKIGECSDSRELQHAIAFLARFPSAYATARTR